MSTAVLRKQVLANNMANISVPHFKRSEVAFEAELKRAIDSERKATETYPLTVTHKDHISTSNFAVRDYRTVNPRVHIDYLSSMRNDGNNVDLEDEKAKDVRNDMSYGLMSNRLGAQFRLLNQLSRLA